MIHELVCPKCGERLRLNETGRAMLERRGPPRCIAGCSDRMREEWEPEPCPPTST